MADRGDVEKNDELQSEPSCSTNNVAETEPSDKGIAEIEEKKQTCEVKKLKIDLLLKATADAPIMKQRKWSVEADRKVSSIIQFIKKYLKLDSQESLFVYVNQAFAPSPDQMLRNLYECFGTDGKLILHYCKTQAWG